MDWKAIEIIVKREAEDAVTNILYEAGLKGTAIESVENLIAVQDDPTINYFDQKILDFDPKISKITGYLPDDDDFDQKLDQIKSGIDQIRQFGLDPGQYQIKTSSVKEEDWATAWQAFYKPTKIGDRVVIVPIWEDYKPSDQEVIVKMDPGMAFGTGTHETTYLCLEVLDKSIKGGERVLDVGTGSGILGIGAILLGAGEVEGIDIDPTAVKVAKENAQLNGVADKFKVIVGDLSDKATGKYDIIVANIVANAVMMLSETIKNFLKEGGLYITSGIIDTRKDEVVAKLQSLGLKILKIHEKNGWVCIEATI